ncbi:RmlC-like cupin domain superfamily [Sesbania bispinosa]|nr:RmlC-like cupin domain superfamily [Sesbania bispinosa]
MGMAETSSSRAGSSSDLTITVESNPSKSRLSEMGINFWPKWGCPPGKYMLKFDAQQTCYLVRGRVKVYPKDSSFASVEFGAGDLVTIPKGFSCTWDVSIAIDKHYKFEPNSSASTTK